MATATKVNDAAKLVLDVEVQALEAISDALNVFEQALLAIKVTLPENLTLDAARIVNELVSQNAYRRSSELPALLNRYNPPAAPTYSPDPAYVAPAMTPVATDGGNVG